MHLKWNYMGHVWSQGAMPHCPQNPGTVVDVCITNHAPFYSTLVWYVTSSYTYNQSLAYTVAAAIIVHTA